jgi:hypothetical protein
MTPPLFVSYGGGIDLSEKLELRETHISVIRYEGAIKANLVRRIA